MATNIALPVQTEGRMRKWLETYHNLMDGGVEDLDAGELTALQDLTNEAHDFIHEVCRKAKANLLSYVKVWPRKRMGEPDGDFMVRNHGYPIQYLMGDGDWLCGECMNTQEVYPVEHPGNEDELLDLNTLQEPQWVVANWQHGSESEEECQCSHCGTDISGYDVHTGRYPKD